MQLVPLPATNPCSGYEIIPSVLSYKNVEHGATFHSCSGNRTGVMMKAKDTGMKTWRGLMFAAMAALVLMMYPTDDVLASEIVMFKSPGMQAPGLPPKGYDILSFDKSGKSQVYKKY
jgi:hypothetical protein